MSLSPTTRDLMQGKLLSIASWALTLRHGIFRASNERILSGCRQIQKDFDELKGLAEEERQEGVH